MNLTQKSPKSKKPFVIAALSVLVLGAIAAGVFFLKDPVQKAIADTQSGPKYSFVFDKALVPSWYSGGGYVNEVPVGAATQEGDQQEDPEVSGIIALECASATQCQTEQDVVGGRCFVSLQYVKGTIDVARAVQEAKKGKADLYDDSLIIEDYGVVAAELTTPDGVKRYDLHRYGLTGPSSRDLQRGVANGYVLLDKRHVRVQAVCQEADQLKDVVPALAAMRLML